MAEAIEEALRAWRVRGVPPNPGAWLTQAARHNALDRLRREQALPREAAALAEPDAACPTSPPRERRRAAAAAVRLLPPGALAGLRSSRSPCGRSAASRPPRSREPRSARETAVGQRIVRAKRKIGAAGIPLRMPEPAERPKRLDIVLTIISVMYSEAHLVAGGDAAPTGIWPTTRVWLARVVAAALPREAEALGSSPCSLFHRAREDARAVDGELVLLADQDRSRWDRGAARRGTGGARSGRAAAAPGRWQLHAAIAACHADAADAATTDWLQVLTLYDMLLAYDARRSSGSTGRSRWPEIEGPAGALAEVDSLEAALSRYHLLARRACAAASRARAATTRRSQTTSERSSSPRTRPSADSSPARAG